MLRAGYGIFDDLGSALGSGGYYGIGFVSSSEYLNVTYPLSSSQLALPAPSVAAPYAGGVVYSFDPQLKLPYAMEYNFSVEQALSSGQKSDPELRWIFGNAMRPILSITRAGWAIRTLLPPLPPMSPATELLLPTMHFR